jgi:hypothetical protein
MQVFCHEFLGSTPPSAVLNAIGRMHLLRTLLLHNRKGPGGIKALLSSVRAAQAPLQWHVATAPKEQWVNELEALPVRP